MYSRGYLYGLGPQIYIILGVTECLSQIPGRIQESKDGGAAGRDRGRQGGWEGARDGWREGRSLCEGFDLMHTAWA